MTVAATLPELLKCEASLRCVDEKSLVQALDRLQPGLPLGKGRATTMTHDYKRNGTTTLFAALNMLDGQVIEGLEGGDEPICDPL